MGDKANIAVKQPDGGRVYLYGHWSGYDMPARLQAALKLNTRWDDAPYLTRIIFDALTAGDAGTTGYGISNYLGDNQRPILVLDCDAKTVTIEDDPRYKRKKYYPCIGRTFGFAEFAALPDVSWEALNG